MLCTFSVAAVTSLEHWRNSDRLEYADWVYTTVNDCLYILSTFIRNCEIFRVQGVQNINIGLQATSAHHELSQYKIKKHERLVQLVRLQNIDKLVVSTWQQKTTDIVVEFLRCSSRSDPVDIAFNLFTWLVITKHITHHKTKTASCSRLS